MDWIEYYPEQPKEISRWSNVRPPLPIITTFQNYTWQDFRQDLVAGSTVSVVLIPQVRVCSEDGFRMFFLDPKC